MDPSEAYARFVLHQLTSDKIVELADAWLASGVYTDSLGELFAIKSPVMAEVGPLFLSAMKELGVNTPDRKAAARLLIHRGFTRVSEGCSDPVFEAEFLYWGVYHEMSNELINEKYLGDSLGLEKVFCWLREIWDCRDGSMILYHTDLPRSEVEMKFKEYLREAAKQWLQDHLAREV